MQKEKQDTLTQTYSGEEINEHCIRFAFRAWRVYPDPPFSPYRLMLMRIFVLLRKLVNNKNLHSLS